MCLARALHAALASLFAWATSINRTLRLRGSSTSFQLHGDDRRVDLIDRNIVLARACFCQTIVERNLRDIALRVAIEQFQRDEGTVAEGEVRCRNRTGCWCEIRPLFDRICAPCCIGRLRWPRCPLDLVRSARQVTLTAHKEKPPTHWPLFAAVRGGVCAVCCVLSS